MAEFNVYVYPDTSQLDDDAVTVKNALKDAINQLHNYGSISSDNGVVIRDDYPNLGNSDLSDFSNWRINNYPFYKGSHLWLTGAWSYNGESGKGQLGSSSTNAWNNPMDAYISTVETDYFGWKKELAIQEVFHNFLYTSAFTDLVEHGHHDLGTLEWDNGNYRVTPMAASYGGSHRKHGSCKAFANWSGYTTQLSSCTKTAIKRCNP